MSIIIEKSPFSEAITPNENRMGTKKTTINPENQTTDKKKMTKKKTVKFQDNINQTKINEELKLNDSDISSGI